MKRALAFVGVLLALVVAAYAPQSRALTPTQMTVLFSGRGCVLLGGICPSADLNFQTQNYYVSGVGTPLSSLVSVSRASSHLCQYANGTWISVGNNTACITDQGFLIEEARTNILQFSQQFDNAYWSKFSSSISADAVAAPDLTTTADKVVEAAATAAHGFQRAAVSVTNATSYTYSVFAKAGERTSVYVFTTAGGSGTHNFDPGSYGAVFNLSNGTVTGADTGISASISPSANGWYRCIFTVTTTSTSGNFGAMLVSGSTTTNYAGDGTSGAYFWQAQLELGSFVTSPIITAGASATRAADIPQLTGAAASAALAAKSAFFQTNGVAGGTGPRLFDNSANTGGNAFFASSTTITFQNNAGNTATATLGSGTYASTVKTALGMDSASLTNKANNGTQATTANAWSPGTVGTEILGNNAAGTRAPNGYMQRFALSPNKGVFDNSTSP